MNRAELTPTQRLIENHADDIAAITAAMINRLVPSRIGDMPYARQAVLETIIRKLQEAV